ncbi:hypothetical protein KL905_005311 [Ogataea polymorpha]|uniref:Mitochondrial carrier protein n=1 Tax=Ogataea polymorpha TaxID=460523 RepID=A0A9P8TBS4_9ASCO|nr:hypothetical protein KL908_005367 [Ogataea polymorpha]KAG7897270.1 hypothetical protein KL935_005341 [Ogataea polymorpha]KAG7898160.1 hypothetical protein KL907_005356 [Ogataea polymorpha]KAG7905164.1 hypothetical protein KL906_005347 [Ogataea polymorpha]KAG7912972.1 hypothetical protein KL927_005393 [Ogataea polymorpha]
MERAKTADWPIDSNSAPLKDEVNSAVQQLSQRNTQVVSASSAGIRAVIYQITSLYMRNPAKLFRPSRFDYLTTARALLHGELASKPWSLRTHSGIALLYQSIKKEGWNFIPRQVLPPIVANSAIGVILYSTYLTLLQRFNKRNMNSIDDPSPVDTFKAGFVAGAAASLAASPLDALYARSNYSELVSGKQKSMWEYALYKLKQIGLVGIFAGFSLNFIKESLGFAFYFSVFELVKNQGYHKTKAAIQWYQYWRSKLFHDEENQEKNSRFFKALNLTFILLAGASAATTLLAIQYPLNKIQKVHLTRLESLDLYNEAHQLDRRRFFKLYYNSYIETFDIILQRWRKSHLSLFGFCYRGFFRSSFTSIPATSIGLFVFEISRQHFSENQF